MKFEATIGRGRWRVVLTLPEPEEMTRQTWDDWRKAVEDTEFQAINHLFGYAGLKFARKHGAVEVLERTGDRGPETGEGDGASAGSGTGTEAAALTEAGEDVAPGPEWIPVTLKEMLSWETRPGEERTMVISWFGREMRRYIELVTDPKG